MKEDFLDKIISELSVFDWKSRVDKRQAKKVIKMLENLKNKDKSDKISGDVIILNNQDRDNLIKTLATPPEANEELKVLFKGEK